MYSGKMTKKKNKAGAWGGCATCAGLVRARVCLPARYLASWQCWALALKALEKNSIW